MKRFLSLPTAFLLGAISAFAGPITCEQAAKNVAQFIYEQKGPKLSRSSMISVSTTTQEKQPYYIFNIGENDGFVIASGDDATYQILGYSFEGCLDVNNIPDNMRAWLDGYAKDLEYIQQLNLPSKSTTEERTYSKYNIPALLSTKWAQDYPYNKFCPDFGDGYGHRPTGCVATAISQVLNFHQWPENETSGVSAYEFEDTYAGGDGTVKKIDALEPTTFDWDAMLDQYSVNSNVKSADAVANLMKYVGHSVKMVYGPYSSGAYATDIIPALVNVFGYKNSAKLLYREYESQEGWNNIIYNELANNRPVIYFGATKSFMGHQFVCDGYENGFYHINWGWAGTSDGFFKLSVLNPEDQGTGGAGYGSSFSEYQNAVIGLEKPVSKDRIYAKSQITDNNNKIPVNIKFDYTSDQFVAADFDLILPEGFMIQRDIKGDYLVEFSDLRSEDREHKVEVNHVSDSKYHFKISSPSLSRFIVSSGDFIKLVLRNINHQNEKKYTATLSQIVFYDVAHNKTQLEDCHFDIQTQKNKAYLYGDANKDGIVNKADVDCIVDYILQKNPTPFDLTLADINMDGDIDITDVLSVSDILLETYGLERHIMLTEKNKSDKLELQINDNNIVLSLSNTTGYKGMQFDLNLPSECNLESLLPDPIRANEYNVHSEKIDNLRYRILLCSPENKNISGNDGDLLTVQFDKFPDSVKVSNVIMVSSDLNKYSMSDVELQIPTEIKQVLKSSGNQSIFTLDGRRLNKKAKGLPKGIYIVNGTKVILK